MKACNYLRNLIIFDKIEALITDNEEARRTEIFVAKEEEEHPTTPIEVKSYCLQGKKHFNFEHNNTEGIGSFDFSRGCPKNCRSSTFLKSGTS